MKYILFILAIVTSSYAGTAYFKYERQTGMTKQCVYEYLGNEYTITIQAIKICPLSISI